MLKLSIFQKHYLSGLTEKPEVNGLTAESSVLLSEQEKVSNVMCDEDLLDNNNLS